MPPAESRKLAIGLAIALVLTSRLMAQSAGTGAVTGVLTDSSRSVIPGATVLVTNVETGQTRSTTTDSSGTYNLPLLPPAVYSVRFAKQGFETAEITGVNVSVTEITVVNRELKVGAQTVRITVTASAPMVQAQNALLGMLVDKSSITTLPLANRNYTQLLDLSAGVSGDVSNAAALGNGSQDVAVNGSGLDKNNYMMDGAPINIIAVNSVLPTAGGFGIPNSDAIQEFKIQTAQYDAGYGRNPGASVNVITRSGTNRLHGSMWEFLRNTNLNANDWFQNRAGGPRPVLDQNQFGGAMGGPIRADKLFYFGSYQGTRQKNGFDPSGYSSGSTLLPLPKDRSNGGALRSYLGAEYCPSGPLGFRTAFGGTQVACDGSNINPVAVNILQAKLPNGAYYVPASETGGVQQDATFSVPSLHNEDQLLINTDYTLARKHVLSERYFYATQREFLSFTGLGLAPELPGAPQRASYSNHDALVKLTSASRANFVNELRASYQRDVIDNRNQVSLTDTQVGITPIIPSVPFITPMTISGLFSVGGSIDTRSSAVNQFEMADQISWIYGRHSMRAGFEGERDQVNWLFPGLARGNILFASFDDFLLGLPGCPPGTFPGACNPSASLFNGVQTTGIPVSNIISTFLSTRTAPLGVYHAFRTNAFSGFLQDDFKIHATFTLNVGLRWEYDGQAEDRYGDSTNVWTSQILTVPVPGNSPATGTFAGFVVPANYQGPPLPPGVLKNKLRVPTRLGAPLDNFAPRLGFAWETLAGERLVMRGGYGWFYDRASLNDMWHATLSNRPYTVTLDDSGPGNWFSTLAQPFATTPLGWATPRWVNFTTGAGSNIVQPFVQEDYTTPLVQQYSLELQYQFLHTWSLEVGYVGSHGIHLADFLRQANLARLASPTSPIYGLTQSTVANAPLRVPYLGFSPLGMQEGASDGNSQFNSLQVTLRKQLSRGLQLQVAYTLAKDLTDLTTQVPSGFGGTIGTLGSSTSNLNGAALRGPAWFYRPKRLVVAYFWTLPVHNTGFSAKAFGGWTLSGVTTIQSGVPITIFDSRGGTIYGNDAAPPSGVDSAAQFCPGMSAADIATPGTIQRRVNNYFNGGAFCSPPVVGDGTGWGNAGVGIIRGPDQNNWDIALEKEIKVREHHTVEFRAEFYNAFNHPQFNVPGGAVTPGASWPTNPALDAAGAAAPGQPQSSTSAFGRITSTSVNPRIIQFAIKYIF